MGVELSFPKFILTPDNCANSENDDYPYMHMDMD